MNMGLIKLKKLILIKMKNKNEGNLFGSQRIKILININRSKS
jgi:hypothetical protein